MTSKPRDAAAISRRHDAGQVLLLVIGFAVILIALVAVVVDASRVFLQRRALSAAADGAVTAAVQSVDERVIYGEPDALARGLLPLDEAEALVAVRQYVADQGLADRFRDLTIIAVEVDPDGRTVTVTVSARVDLPFARFVPADIQSVTITASAGARAPTE